MQGFSRVLDFSFYWSRALDAAGRLNSMSVSFTKMRPRLPRGLKPRAKPVQKVHSFQLLRLLSRVRCQFGQCRGKSCLTSCFRLPIVRRERRRSVASPKFRRSALHAFHAHQGDARAVAPPPMIEGHEPAKDPPAPRLVPEVIGESVGITNLRAQVAYLLGRQGHGR